ncbi:MAG: O-acetyl-ADP-ribose deacetylase [Anaerolineaceae bacterium]|nr:O-acetyl-ADP-ribose deacetylase [Anaerolineaceae bacterium]
MPNPLIYRVQINQATIELIEGDITKQTTDAIVNAANASLLGGGGVDGAIHRAAGSELLAETRTLGGCQTGDAKITRGYKLKAKFVIHGVGPIYQAHNTLVQQQLASVYRRSMELAEANGIRTISFPSISTGAYGYPVEEAAPIALKAVIDYVIQHNGFERVAFILFNEQITETYAHALAQLAKLYPDIIKVL